MTVVNVPPPNKAYNLKWLFAIEHALCSFWKEIWTCLNELASFSTNSSQRTAQFHTVFATCLASGQIVVDFQGQRSSLMAAKKKLMYVYDVGFGASTLQRLLSRNQNQNQEQIYCQEGFYTNEEFVLLNKVHAMKTNNKQTVTIIFTI